MNLWAWVLAYVVGFSLLQVLIYRYLSGRREGGASTHSGERPTARTTPGTEQWAGEGHPAGGDPPQGVDPLSVAREPDEPETHSVSKGRHCPRCGTLNEADGAFTYCWNCTRPLG